MQTIGNRIYKELASQIVNGGLAPGRKLEEALLATQFGVSRTPIREALRELAARGLIQLEPRRGGVVRHVGLDQLIDMLEAECEIEALCAKRAALQMTALEKSELEALFSELTLCASEKQQSAYLEKNQQFHLCICNGAHNQTLAEMAKELRERLTPFRQQHAVSIEARLTQSIQEHRDILSAIRTCQAEAAYQAMLRHNARLSVGVLALLRKQSEIGDAVV